MNLTQEQLLKIEDNKAKALERLEKKKKNQLFSSTQTKPDLTDVTALNRPTFSLNTFLNNSHGLLSLSQKDSISKKTQSQNNFQPALSNLNHYDRSNVNIVPEDGKFRLTHYVALI